MTIVDLRPKRQVTIFNRAKIGAMVKAGVRDCLFMAALLALFIMITIIMGR